jgi:hypothetical protein
MDAYNPIYDTCARCDELGDVCETCEGKRFVISSTGKALVDGGADWVADHVAMDCDELAAGATFADLFNLPQWLPACYSRHYTPALLDRFLLAVALAGWQNHLGPRFE